MASELRVNTLKDASGNNSVGMSTVAEGTAKSWTYIIGDGSPTVADSFNTASLTDHATAQIRSNFTNNMNNDDFCFVTFVQENAFIAVAQELTTTSGRIRTTAGVTSVTHTTSTQSDVDGRNHIVTGDLA